MKPSTTPSFPPSEPRTSEIGVVKRERRNWKHVAVWGALVISLRFALHLHQHGLPHARFRDVAAPLAFSIIERRNADRLSRLSRFVKRLDESHVLQALMARWLRDTVVQNAV